MNINIKNCEVNIITGTDTLEISGNAQPAAAEAPAESTRPAESKESGFISEMTYSVSAFMKNFDNVRIGDRVKLPAFTVPAVKMDGEESGNWDQVTGGHVSGGDLERVRVVRTLIDGLGVDDPILVSVGVNKWLTVAVWIIECSIKDILNLITNFT